MTLNTYNGSDFNRNEAYSGDVVYSRYLTISARLLNSWRSDKVQLVDNIDIRTFVPKDKKNNVDLGLENQTIKVK
jgi:hypothetical protein